MVSVCSEYTNVGKATVVLPIEDTTSKTRLLPRFWSLKMATTLQLFVLLFEK